MVLGYIVGVHLYSLWIWSVRQCFCQCSTRDQWILGLLSPLVKDISIAILFKVAYKSAEDGEQGRYFMKFSVIHNITTKHAVFLAILVGNVATPTTTYCIIFVDFAKALYSTLKIIHNKRNGRNIEGNL